MYLPFDYEIHAIAYYYGKPTLQWKKHDIAPHMNQLNFGEPGNK
jgi:hypothetical protein